MDRNIIALVQLLFIGQQSNTHKMPTLVNVSTLHNFIACEETHDDSERTRLLFKSPLSLTHHHDRVHHKNLIIIVDKLSV